MSFACPPVLAMDDDPVDQVSPCPIEQFTLCGAFLDGFVEFDGNGLPRTKYFVEGSLETYAAPLRSRPVDEIDTEAVLAVLKPLWLEKPETASRLRGRIEAVLDAAKAQGHRSAENPAAWRGNLAHLLPRRGKLTRGHHAAMDYQDVPAFIGQLRERDGIAALPLKFCILTATRSGEVYGARWSEIDMAAKFGPFQRPG